LNNILYEAYCTECFSTGKDEMVLQFKTRKKEPFQLLAKFIDGELIYRFFAPTVSFSRKSLKQLKVLEGLQVHKVKHRQLERIFSIEFVHGYELLFKGFGRLGNVFLFEKELQNPTQIFRGNIAADMQFNRYNIRHWPIEDATFMAGINSAAELGFLPPELQSELETANFAELDPTQKSQVVLDSINKAVQGNFFRNADDSIPKLFTLPRADRKLLGTGLPALDAYAEAFIYQKLFQQEKQRILGKTEKDLKHFRKLYQDNLQRVERIKERRSYKELGDIVMSFAHSIKPGVANAFLTDYYTGNPIRVKLDPNLSAAENAQKYYRKAKNEVLELQHAQENADLASGNIEKLEKTLAEITEAVSFKHLKGNRTEPKAQEPAKALPYKEEVFQDFTFWVGKSAKGNDEMLKLAGKNDLWLHAKGVAGSHVIIKKQGAVFPEPVIAHGAKLAAMNSKAKTQSVVQVICIERKFVTKGKQAAPGEVKVMKENIVDAFLD
jgi:predicted ribosome quality control (RQC) complex YloA/Tae2 family protein